MGEHGPIVIDAGRLPDDLILACLQAMGDAVGVAPPYHRGYLSRTKWGFVETGMLVAGECWRRGLLAPVGDGSDGG